MICGLVYPKREKERGVWLFNHILKLRGGFMKYKRRKARQQFSNRKNLEEASMVGKLAAQYDLSNVNCSLKHDNTCIVLP